MARRTKNLLLAACLLLLALASPVQAQRRRLAQEAAAATDGTPWGEAPFIAPAPAPEGEAVVDVLQQCISLTGSAGQSCTTESDTMSLIYPRDSKELPTPDEVTRALSQLKSAAGPSEGCCVGIKPFVEAMCPCQPEFQQVVPVGGFDKNYFIGATYILALACNLDFPSNC